MTAGALAEETRFGDDLRADAPELEELFAAAAAELLAVEAPSADPRLEALLGAGLRRSARRRSARRMALAGGVGAVAIVATTGLAAAAVLPAPVQRVVAEVASKVGLDLPRAETVAVTVPPAPAAAPTTAAPASSSTATTAPSTTAAATTDARALDAASPAPAVAAPPAAAAAPPAAAAAPPTSASVAAFLGAAADFRACVAASRSAPETDASDAPCTPPDPAAFGLPTTADPPDLGALRAALAAYRSCLRTAAGRDQRIDCHRGWRGGVAKGPTTSPPPTPATSVSPAPTSLEAFRAAVLAYVACLRSAGGDLAALRACPRPDPRAYGLAAWPIGVPLAPGAGGSSPAPSRSPGERTGDGEAAPEPTAAATADPPEVATSAASPGSVRPAFSHRS